MTGLPAEIGTGDLRLETRESAALQQLREALDAVAVAPPAAYRLYRGAAGCWHVRGTAQPDHCFLNRERALAAMHLAVVRCSAYCLYLRGEDGHVDIECLNWPINPTATPVDSLR